MSKLDFKRELKSLYAPGRKVVEELSVPRFNFLMVDGEGDPDTSVAYRQAVEALFSVSYQARARDRLHSHAVGRPLVGG